MVPAARAEAVAALPRRMPQARQARPGRISESGPDLSLGLEGAREGLGTPVAARAPPAPFVQRVDDRGVRAPGRPVCETDHTRHGAREPRVSRAHSRADARARRAARLEQRALPEPAARGPRSRVRESNARSLRARCEPV